MSNLGGGPAHAEMVSSNRQAMTTASRFMSCSTSTGLVFPDRLGIRALACVAGDAKHLSFEDRSVCCNRSTICKYVLYVGKVSSLDLGDSEVLPDRARAKAMVVWLG